MAVDWQVEVQPDTAASAVREPPCIPTPHGDRGVAGRFRQVHRLRLAAPVQAPKPPAPQRCLGIPSDYRAQFPDAIRTLVGADVGVLLAQQTAANLHAAPGDTVQIGRAGMAPVDRQSRCSRRPAPGRLTVPERRRAARRATRRTAGQRGDPRPGPVAPHLRPALAARPDLVRIQIHITLDHQLARRSRLPPTPGQRGGPTTSKPAAPAAPWSGTTWAPHWTPPARDAAYAQVLFVFLGLPAAVLAALLTATVVAAGADRRRHDQALLRARGASPRS